MTFPDCLVILLAKGISFTSRLFRLGAGGTWSGEIALRLRPGIIQSFQSQAIHIILVAGTNGKTTTVKMIETVLKAQGKKVVHNSSGANLDNGLASTFIANSNWNGSLRAKYFIFEVDEATVPVILKYLHPQAIVLLNLFRDQLDRYGEVDAIAEKWLAAFQQLPVTTQLIINGDDPQLAYLGMQLKTKVTYFGLDNPELFLPKMQHATDSIYCPRCGNRLTFGGVYFSHLGKYACGQCSFTHPTLELTAKDIFTSLEGVYNLYNILAATLLSRIEGVAKKDIEESLATFTPAFGRMEELTVSGHRVRILLSKNPTGFNESLRTYLSSKKQGPLLLVLNDRIPDGTDVSWIWDVDFEILRTDEHMTKERDRHMIFVSGDRCFDLGLRLKYAGVDQKIMELAPQLETAVSKAVDSVKAKETLWIFATYSGMLDVRKILVGRKIL